MTPVHVNVSPSWRTRTFSLEVAAGSCGTRRWAIGFSPISRKGRWDTRTPLDPRPTRSQPACFTPWIRVSRGRRVSTTSSTALVAAECSTSLSLLCFRAKIVVSGSEAFFVSISEAISVFFFSQSCKSRGVRLPAGASFLPPSDLWSNLNPGGPSFLKSGEWQRGNPESSPCSTSTERSPPLGRCDLFGHWPSRRCSKSNF